MLTFELVFSNSIFSETGIFLFIFRVQNKPTSPLPYCPSSWETAQMFEFSNSAERGFERKPLLFRIIKLFSRVEITCSHSTYQKLLPMNFSSKVSISIQFSESYICNITTHNNREKIGNKNSDTNASNISSSISK